MFPRACCPAGTARWHRLASAATVENDEGLNASRVWSSYEFAPLRQAWGRRTCQPLRAFAEHGLGLPRYLRLELPRGEQVGGAGHGCGPGLVGAQVGLGSVCGACAYACLGHRGAEGVGAQKISGQPVKDRDEHGAPE